MQIRLIPVLFSIALLPACEPSGSLDLAGAGAPNAASTISGRAEVVDGDSLEIAGTSIRIFGVDAFEGQQSCERNGAAWRCGDAAELKLAELVGTSFIICEQRDIDTYGRTVARCTNGTLDLAAELARSGLALAYRQYSGDYVDEETEAQAARRGAWAGTFDEPWDWRRGNRADPAAASGSTPPLASGSAQGGDCQIKGNISRDGERIYHLPGTSSYEPTVIDESNGERWFCSEAEAVAAGWRAPRAR